MTLTLASSVGRFSAWPMGLLTTSMTTRFSRTSIDAELTWEATSFGSPAIQPFTSERVFSRPFADTGAMRVSYPALAAASAASSVVTATTG